MSRKPKLELTWIGKEHRPRLEPRILLEDPVAPLGKSYHAEQRVTENDLFDNRLIFGDNLLALKALEQEFTSKVKCIFIDPPYNTGNAFGSYYDDGIEHSLWLSLIRDRIELLHKLLSESGSLWITIDDNECHYLKIICDEIFGRCNYIASAVWEKDKGGRGDADISLSHDYVLIYAKHREEWKKVRNLLSRTAVQQGRFKNPDNDPRGPWRQGDDGTAKSGTEKQRFPILLPSGRLVTPKEGRYWAFSEETFKKAVCEGRAYFGRKGNSLPIIKRYQSEVREGVAPRTWWNAEEVGTNQSAKRDHLRKLMPDIEPFPTPKPEELIARVIEIASNPGDLILDSFAGSGTTGAVAHKMGRRWIMIELGEHCHTHIIPRLQKVIDGTDQGGISQSVGWQGGGGFRYYKLAPSLLEKDRWDRWVISKQYNAAMLAEAMCKHMGFTYAPSDTHYWMHGYSSERDLIYVTTASLTYEQVRAISESVGDERTLLICCKAHKCDEAPFPNVTVKKIPRAVLTRCEWGQDDYSLNVANLQPAPVPDVPPAQLSLMAPALTEEVAQ